MPDASHSARERREQALYVGGIEQRPGGIARIENAGSQGALALLQLDYALLDRALGYQLVDEHRLALTDAVRPIGSLVFHRGVPPGIIVDHGIGGGQVEPGAAGTQADEEQRHLALLKPRDWVGAV